MITLQTKISRNENDFLVSELGNEIVMMNTGSGDYLGLNEVSSDIWKLLEQPISPEAIIEQLVSMYDINPEECEAQTMKFLGKMHEQNMITIAA